MSAHSDVVATLAAEIADVDATVNALLQRRALLVRAHTALLGLNGEAAADVAPLPSRPYRKGLNDKILSVIAERPYGVRASVIARLVDREQTQIGGVLRRLVGAGRIIRVDTGIYGMPPQERAS